MTTPSGEVTLPEISEEDLKDAAKAATKALKTLDSDRASVLLTIKKYLDGDHPGPYIPLGADTEYRFLAKRATDNWIPTALKAPSQALYVEGHHLSGSSERSPAWACWQRNRLDGRQTGLYRDALAYGESYVFVQKADALNPMLVGFGKATMWSRLSTVALYEDPVNDPRPAFVVHVKQWAESDKPGVGIAVDRDHVYDVSFDSEFTCTLSGATAHGMSDCPVVSFVPYRDLEGTPQSILSPLFAIQDRINQTTFDRLIVQQYSSYKVRYVTGMTPPSQRVRVPVTKAMAIADGTIDPDDPRYEAFDDNVVVGSRFDEVLDNETGEPVHQNVTASASRMLVLADADAKVGTLDETPIDGFLAATDADVHHFAAVGQLPPYYLGVDLANLSADALAVAESSLWRMVSEFQHSFGESWEQVMQLFAEAEAMNGADDFDSEVLWRDTSARSIGQVVDALGKAVSQLGVPGEALWGRIPNTTADEVAGWKQLRSEQAVQTANSNDQTGGLAASTTSANARYAQALAGGGTPTKPVTARDAVA